MNKRAIKTIHENIIRRIFKLIVQKEITMKIGQVNLLILKENSR